MEDSSHYSDGLVLMLLVLILAHGLLSSRRRLLMFPILLGPLEKQQIEKESLDLIVLMDVLEHFADPVAAMKPLTFKATISEGSINK